MHPALCLGTSVPRQKLEVFIEHIPHVECLQGRVQLQSLGISADAHQTCAITYTVFVYGHIPKVWCRIYNDFLIVKLKRWGQICYG